MQKTKREAPPCGGHTIDALYEKIMSEDIQIMVVPVTITGQQVNDLLVSALESCRWIENICLFDRNNKPTINCTNPVQNLSGIEICTGKATINLLMPPSTDLEKGLKAMADKYPRHFASVISESGIKNHMADLFLQCCLFGEVKNL